MKREFKIRVNLWKYVITTTLIRINRLRDAQNGITSNAWFTRSQLLRTVNPLGETVKDSHITQLFTELLKPVVSSCSMQSIIIYSGS